MTSYRLDTERAARTVHNPGVRRAKKRAAVIAKGDRTIRFSVDKRACETGNVYIEAQHLRHGYRYWCFVIDGVHVSMTTLELKRRVEAFGVKTACRTRTNSPNKGWKLKVRDLVRELHIRDHDVGEIRDGEVAGGTMGSWPG